MMVAVVLKGGLLACWLAIVSISLNHLYPAVSFLSSLSTSFLGILGWAAALLTIVVLGKGFLWELFVLAISFFILGCILGPFLEPPADPLEHLRRIHEETCSKTVEQLPINNKGLWHYSMAGVVLCSTGDQVQPETMLRKIDVVNGMFWALMVASLFILGKRAGLPGRWAFLSVLICFLFFGTNRFSYFRYYSLAPSASSLCVYWLWTAAFFFKESRHTLIIGSAAAVLLLPVIWVNHSQEAVFLGFTLLIWGIINSVFGWGKSPLPLRRANGVSRRFSGNTFIINGAGIFLVVVVCWLLPQFEFFREILSRFFVRDFGEQYQRLAVSWHGLYVGGRIAGLRVVDTLGMTAVGMMFVAVPYFWPGFLKGKMDTKVRIGILAVLPFIGFFVPLFHYVWSANVQIKEYYRLCYVSMFWLFFADFLYRVETKVCGCIVGEKNCDNNHEVQQLEK